MAFEWVTNRVCHRHRISTERINQGHCYEWASLATQRCPSAQVFYVRRLMPHAFIYFAGLWFDADAPKGVRDWRALPLFKGCRGLLREQGVIRWVPGDRFWLNSVSEKRGQDFRVTG